MNRLIFLALIISSSLWAQEAQEHFLLKGLRASEGLFEFLSTHPCEIGLERGCERALSAQDQRILKTLLRDLEEWRVISYDGFAPMSSLDITGPFELREGPFSLTSERRFSWRTLKQETIQVITLNDDLESQNFLHQTQMGVATNLVLYDSFFRLLETLSQAKKLRQLIEVDMPLEGSWLKKTLGLALDELRWEETRHSMLLIEQIQFSQKNVFQQYIVKSATAQQMKKGKLDSRLRKVLFIQGQIQESRFFTKIYEITGILSKLFGNATGLFQMRKGKLKDLSALEVSSIKSKLKPLSVLLEKTPFRLTDKFIPGYFGHVAIWLGETKELMNLKILHQGREIDLLSHPQVLPHLEKLSVNRNVLEALRLPGVTLNTLESFLDVDDLVVLDPPQMSDDERSQFLLQAFQQIGKPYDFNFNVESESEIVCSELIYTVYDSIDWPTNRSFGRHTISPDHVAWRAIDQCFQPRLAYFAGKKIKDDISAELKKVLESKEGLEYQSRGGCL